MTVAISLFRSAFDRLPTMRRASIGGLATSLTRFRVIRTSDKRSLPAWSPAEYEPGATRARANVVSLSCLVLDYDDGVTMDDASRTWSDWPHIIHTSWSHTPEKHRFRLILPLERPVPARYWLRVWAWAERHSGRTIDPACKDPSRIYFVPAVRSDDWPRYAEVVEPGWGGSYLLDVDYERLPETDEERIAREAREARASRTVALRVSRGEPDWKIRRRAQEVLKADPAARERAAHALGARIVHGWARGAKCPRCGRNSVWWWLEPRKMAGAQCDHRDSCGWYGWLDQLLDELAA